MKTAIFRKGMVIGIIGCFVGAGVIPSISGNILGSLKTIYADDEVGTATIAITDNGNPQWIGICDNSNSVGGQEGEVTYEWDYNKNVNGFVYDVLLQVNPNAETSSSLNEYELYINGNSVGNPISFIHECGATWLNWTNLNEQIVGNIVFEIDSCAHCYPGMLWKFSSGIDWDGDGDTSYSYSVGGASDDYINGIVDGEWTDNRFDMAYRFYFYSTSEKQPPTVQITQPTGGTFSGTIPIQGTAADSDGTVTQVQVKIDSGSSWWTATGTTSWNTNWDTTTVSDGSHTIYARSKDNDDAYSTEDFVTVNVYNNNPPYEPSNPNPTDGATGVDVNADLSWTGGDPDPGDTVTYDVYFGVDPTPDSNELVSIKQSSTMYDPGSLDINVKYYWRIVAWDNHGASSWGGTWQFTTGGNNPPDTPITPDGPILLKVDEIGTYYTSTTDPDGDQIRYQIDWDDICAPMWTDYVDSGETVSQWHGWTSPGTYYVKAQAEDIHGAQSSWSDPLIVTISDGETNLPTAEIISISPNPAGVKSPTGLNGKAGGDPVAFVASASAAPGYTISKYIWKCDGAVIPNSNFKEFSIADLSVGGHTISLVVEDSEGKLSDEVVWGGKLEIVDGLVFRPPYGTPSGSVSYLTTDPIRVVINPMTEEADSEEVHTDGDGTLIAEAYRNDQRGDVYVYAYGDTEWDPELKTCRAWAGQFVTFKPETSTQYISLNAKIHTIGGATDNFPWGGASTRIGYQAYFKNGLYWAYDNWALQDIDPMYGLLDVITAFFGPVSTILSLPVKIATILELFIAMSAATTDVMSFNEMLSLLQDGDKYETIPYCVERIAISHTSREHALMVGLGAGFGGYWMGVGKACRIGLFEHIIIRKASPPDPPCCFPAGTKITMTDGSYKNIEDIDVGDKVLSYDLENKEFTSWKVKVLERPVVHIYNINNGLIKTSRDHPFYIKKKDERTGWGAVEPLQNAFRIPDKILKIEVGDKLFTSDGKWITVKDISYNSSPMQTYNILSYLGNKNYFANDLLVYEDYQTLSYLIKQAFQESRTPLRYLLNFFRQRNYIFLP